MTRRQIDRLRDLAELDANLLDCSEPKYRAAGFPPPSIDFLKSAEAKRQELCRRIDEKYLIEYERIRKRYGSRAVVQVVSEFCSGCYVRLPSEMLTRKKTEVMTCPNCGRILYMLT